MPKIKDKTGMHYGHWVVLGQDLERTQATGKIYWLCECDCGCGTRKSIRGDALIQVTIGGCKNMVGNPSKICEKCGQLFAPKKQAKTRKYCYNCVPEENYSGATIRQKIKQWGLEYKGCKCEICGYNKCIDALDFHHLDPKEKDFNLSDRNIPLNWPIIKQELDKCILVCANCHREIHAKNKGDM